MIESLPRYPYPPGWIPALARDALLGRVRSFRRDALACVERIVPAPDLSGADPGRIATPCVVTVNHYARPGFHAWWIALAIAAALPVEMHWTMTGEWTFPGRWYGFAARPLSRFVLARLARVYGFTAMPPMPPRPQDVEAHAKAVRRVVELARSRKNLAIGLAPEGGDQVDGKLSMPAPGAGRFALLLAGCGLDFVPVGAYETGGRLRLSFGDRYRLEQRAGSSSAERDRAAARVMMEHIAAQLPPALRGEFLETP
jgi:hypothetical protein